MKEFIELSFLDCFILGTKFALFLSVVALPFIVVDLWRKARE